jgi:hypothetical protein
MFIESLIDWFHHITQPHCMECNECKGCVILKEQLNAERINNKKLIDAIVNQLNPPVREVVEKTREPEEIKTAVPWKVRREMLEREDRIAAQKLKDNLDMQNANKLNVNINEMKEENAS